MNNAGQMRQVAADAYWDTICGDFCTEETVESMLYMPVYNSRENFRYFNQQKQEPIHIVRDPAPIIDDFVPLPNAETDRVLEEAGLGPDPGPSGASPQDAIDPEDDVFLTGYERIKKTLAKRRKTINSMLASDGEDDDEEEEAEAPTSQEDAFIDDRAEEDLSVDGSSDEDDE